MSTINVPMSPKEYFYFLLGDKLPHEWASKVDNALVRLIDALEKGDVKPTSDKPVAKTDYEYLKEVFSKIEHKKRSDYFEKGRIRGREFYRKNDPDNAKWGVLISCAKRMSESFQYKLPNNELIDRVEECPDLGVHLIYVISEHAAPYLVYVLYPDWNTYDAKEPFSGQP